MDRILPLHDVLTVLALRLLLSESRCTNDLAICLSVIYLIRLLSWGECLVCIASALLLMSMLTEFGLMLGRLVSSIQRLLEWNRLTGTN